MLKGCILFFKACDIIRHMAGVVNLGPARLTIVIPRAPQDGHETLCS